MKRNIGIALLTLLVASATAATREYDVDVYRNFNGWALGSNGVTESFTNTADSLLWAEFFVGAANSQGPLNYYGLEVTDPTTHDVMYSGTKGVTGQHYEYIRFDTLQFHRPLIKGKEYVLKVTFQSLNPYDSFNWYADTTNPYQYGRMFAGQDAPLRWDLSARVEGVNRAVDKDHMAILGELYALPGTGCPVVVRDSLNQLMAGAGVGWDRELWPWWRIQRNDSASFDWSVPDSVMLSAAQHNIKVFPLLYTTPSWTCTHIEHLGTGDESSRVCMPRNLGEPVAPLVQTDTVNPNQFWGRFVFEAIMRYGPNGTFWSEHSGFDWSLAVTDWEVWNEGNYFAHGTVTPDAGFGYPVPNSWADTVSLQNGEGHFPYFEGIIVARQRVDALRKRIEEGEVR
jgi:hypothetical protein